MTVIFYLVAIFFFALLIGFAGKVIIGGLMGAKPEMKNREIANNNSAMVQRADFISPPSMALPIWAAISVVRVFVVEKMLVGSAVV